MYFMTQVVLSLAPLMCLGQTLAVVPILYHHRHHPQVLLIEIVLLILHLSLTPQVVVYLMHPCFRGCLTPVTLHHRHRQRPHHQTMKVGRPNLVMIRMDLRLRILCMGVQLLIIHHTRIIIMIGQLLLMILVLALKLVLHIKDHPPLGLIIIICHTIKLLQLTPYNPKLVIHPLR